MALLRFAIIVALTAAAWSSPAFACDGSTVLFTDNFQTAEPAWHGSIAISGGQANVTASPGDFGGAFYGSMFIDSGDACVDVMGPGLQNWTQAVAGIIFGFTDIDNFYAFMVEEDGQAVVVQKQNGGILHPVGLRAAPGFKTGANVTNTLRVTWNGSSAATYINSQPFVTFNISPLQNSMIGLYVETDLSTPITYQFSNLKVTNVPSQ